MSDHPHPHEHRHPHDSGETPLMAIFWLNTLFAILEIGGGIYTNSVSILSNALHDLGDSLSLGCAFYFEKVSRKTGDAIYTYGYRRFALLGAFTNSLVLLIGSVFILQESFQRFFHAEPVKARGILLMAVVGILVNGVAAIRLFKGKSMNERVVFLHFIEDVLGWVAVLIGGTVMVFVNLPILDPILSVLISAYILFNVFRNLRTIARVILQGTPDHTLSDKITAELQSIPGIVAHHDVHVWSLDGRYNIASLHLVLTDMGEGESVKSQVRQNLQALDLHHVTIETEIEAHACQDCQLKP